MKIKKIIAITLLFATISAESALACTNILVTRGASRTGSTMVSYSADSHSLYGSLYHCPAGTYTVADTMDVYDWDSGKFMGRIPQALETYSVVGNMNEHQLLIGESTWGGLEQLRDPDAIIDYGSLIYITLQRAKTAREAIAVIGELVQNYGYASSGESLSIADPNEVWVLEIISKGSKIVDGKNADKGAVWVARRLPDGVISAHANQSRITTFPLKDPENCIYTPDIFDFARRAGLYKGKDKDFDFAKVFNPFDYSGMRGCEARVWSVFRQVTDGMDQYLDHVTGKNPENRLPLWVTPKEKVTLAQVADFMRNHYEGTPLDMTCDLGAGGHKLPYRWRPMTFKVGEEEFTNERAIATQQTGWWYVGECRNWLPDPVGGVLWFGTDDAATSPLTPIYCSSTRVAPSLEMGNGHMTKYSTTSMFWIQNRVSNFAYMRYDMISKDVRRAMDRFQDRCFEEQPAIDAAAKMLYDKNPTTAVAFLTDYSVNTAQRLFETWVDLDQYLFVKYMDGNMKQESAEGVFIDNGNGRNIPVGPSFPGYNEQWKEMVKGSAGQRLKVIQPK